MIELPAGLTFGSRARRAVALLLFLVALVLFRKLAVIGVVFVAANAGLGGLVDLLSARTKLSPRVATVIAFGVFIAFIALLLALGISRSLRAYRDLAGGGLEDRLNALRASEPVQQIEAMDIDLKPVFEWTKELAGRALEAARLSGEILVHALIGFLIALVYRLDRAEVDGALAAIDPRSILGLFLRYAGFLGEAAIAALKLQVVVALVNTALTSVVILALRLHGAPTLIALVFFLGLIPVAGNIISGGILCVLAYIHHGLLGVAIFLVSTFALHKLESFYLNPRLTRRHVHLPPLAIIVSLIAFEHLFGVVGLFLSFPAIYLVLRIARDLKEASGAGAQSALWGSAHEPDQAAKGGAP